MVYRKNRSVGRDLSWYRRWRRKQDRFYLLAVVFATLAFLAMALTVVIAYGL